ncbi:MFS transporter [Actinomadura parmotrematis]|uniref:MFS transporter n=1 Tax=Actinomadura parmotrematis TaxID=2864039 RepID=A0ABS7FY58_9ACTN|nr:MFS transporter [Actinomadura parmotrematis]MBW8485368.1 MFS transporter [Actinomadura parmotrematis]
MRSLAPLPVILAATFMASFDFMVVNVATPSFRHDLGAGPAALELIVAGYAFTYASGLVTGGRLGDLYGHRRLFALGMAAFALASLLCGLAPTAGWLVAGRLLQGLTAAAMVPQVLALITAVLPAADRPRGMAWYGAVLGGGGVLGQVAGGAVVDAWGWRPIFLVNVPVGLAAAALAVRVLPPGGGPRARLDVLGAAGLSGGLALLLVPLVLGRSEGWPVWIRACLAASVPVLAATLWWERRRPAPLLDLALFRSRAFSVGLAINVAFMAAFGALNLVVTLLLQTGLHRTPLQAGLTYGPMALTTMVASLAARPLLARAPRAVMVTGAVLSALSTLLPALELHVAGASVTAPVLALSLLPLGAGSGLLLPAVIGAVLAGVEPARAGGASGVLSTAQQFSGALGVAGIGTLFFALGPVVRAAEGALWAVTGLAALAAALVPLLPVPGRAPAARPEAARQGAPAESGTA